MESTVALDMEALRSGLLLRSDSENCSSTQRQVVTWMRWMLSGPDWHRGGGRRARTTAASARIWASSCAVFGITTGYLARAYQEFNFGDNPIPVWWNVLGYTLQGLASFSGVVMMEVTSSIAGRLSHSGVFTGSRASGLDDAINASSGHDANGSNMDFLGTVLTSRISDNAQRDVKRMVFFCIANIVSLFVGFVAIIAVFVSSTQEFNAEADTDFVLQMCQFLAVICAPIQIIVMAGWGIFLNVPRVIVVDHIRHAAECVRSIKFDPSKPDHKDEVNVMFFAVVSSHERMVRLSSLLAPAITVNFFIPASFALYFIAMGTVPRGEGTEADWINDQYPRPWFILEATCMWLIIVGPFVVLSSSTAACDELVAAVTSNINIRCAVADRECSLAPPRDLIRMQGVRDYFRGLNRNQGVGFTWRGVRVSPRIVRKISLSGCAALLVWLWFAWNIDY